MQQQRVLFYPAPEDANASGLASKVALFPAIVTLLLFAIFSPVVLILIPVAWLTSFYDGVPFTLFSDPDLMVDRCRRQLKALNKKNR